MFTFEADIMIDGFNPQHVKGLKKCVGYITDAIISDLEDYRHEDTDGKIKWVTQGFKFKATFALLSVPTKEWLTAKVNRDILSYFSEAREVWCECYSIDPEPPRLDIIRFHPRQAEWNKKAREKRQAKRASKK